VHCLQFLRQQKIKCVSCYENFFISRLFLFAKTWDLRFRRSKILFRNKIELFLRFQCFSLALLLLLSSSSVLPHLMSNIFSRDFFEFKFVDDWWIRDTEDQRQTRLSHTIKVLFVIYRKSIMNYWLRSFKKIIHVHFLLINRWISRKSFIDCIRWLSWLYR
jgi:hypothetical protein